MREGAQVGVDQTYSKGCPEDFQNHAITPTLDSILLHEGRNAW